MRLKEFNANSVLEKSIDLFWNTSFGHCSIKDIVEVTGVNRFSLYEEFENKEGILLTSMDLYIDRRINPKLELLEADEKLSDTLSSFYMSLMNDNPKHPSGCYIIRIATELADNNQEVRAKLDAYLQILENKFLALLEKYPETKNNTSYFAKHLLGLFCSLTTFCVIHSFQERKSLVKSGLSMLFKNHSNYATHA